MQSQRLEILAGLARHVEHDLDNALTVLTGYVEVLQDESAGESLRQGDLEGLHRAAERVTGLIHQFLTFSCRRVLPPVVLDLNDIVRTLEPTLRRIVDEDRIVGRLVLVVRTDARPALVRADPAQIEQVVLNLVVAARDAMPTGGAISVESRLNGAHAELVVSHATAVDRRAQRRRVEPLAPSRGVSWGTGVHQATVSAIAEQIGGEVLAASEPGVGRSVTVRVRCTRVDGPIDGHGAERDAGPSVVADR